MQKITGAAGTISEKQTTPLNDRTDKEEDLVEITVQAAANSPLKFVLLSGIKCELL